MSNLQYINEITAATITKKAGINKMKKYVILIALIVCASASINAADLIPFYCEDDKIGFKNELGKVVVECEYDNASSGRGRLRGVEKDNKWGFIDDTTGKEVIPCMYDDFGKTTCEYDFYKDGLPMGRGFFHGRALVKKDDRWFYIDKTNTEVECPP